MAKESKDKAERKIDTFLFLFPLYFQLDLFFIVCLLIVADTVRKCS